MGLNEVLASQEISREGVSVCSSALALFLIKGDRFFNTYPVHSPVLPSTILKGTQHLQQYIQTRSLHRLRYSSRGYGFISVHGPGTD